MSRGGSRCDNKAGPFRAVKGFPPVFGRKWRNGYTPVFLVLNRPAMRKRLSARAMRCLNVQRKFLPQAAVVKPVSGDKTVRDRSCIVHMHTESSPMRHTRIRKPAFPTQRKPPARQERAGGLFFPRRTIRHAKRNPAYARGFSARAALRAIRPRARPPTRRSPRRRSAVPPVRRHRSSRSASAVASTQAAGLRRHG